MGPRIAILLSGFPSDLPVGFSAVQLAARTESKLYALQDSELIGLRHCDMNSVCDATHTGAYSLQESFRVVGELADVEGVPVSYHVLEGGSVNDLGGFLIDHSISCLVIYAAPKKDPVARIAWIEELQMRLNASPRWFHGTLQVIVAPSWDEKDMQEAISRLQSTNQVPGKAEGKTVS